MSCSLAVFNDRVLPESSQGLRMPEKSEIMGAFFAIQGHC